MGEREGGGGAHVRLGGQEHRQLHTQEAGELLSEHHVHSSSSVIIRLNPCCMDGKLTFASFFGSFLLKGSNEGLGGEREGAEQAQN